MAWLQQAGIDIIIASWWGQGGYEDQVIPTLLEQAADYGIQVAFQYDPDRRYLHPFHDSGGLDNMDDKHKKRIRTYPKINPR